MFDPEIKGLNSVRQLREEGKIKEALQIILKLEQTEDLSLKELLSYKLAKADLLRSLGNYSDAIEIAQETYDGFQSLGDLVSSLDSLLIQAYSYMIMVNITQSEHLIPQAENLFKAIKDTLTLDLRERESLFVRIKANIHFSKGEIQRSLKLNKRAYELAKDICNEQLISASLNNIASVYYNMKKYDEAIIYAKQAVKVNHNLTLAVALSTLIEINASKGNIKEAKVYLECLREHSEKFDSKWNKTCYYSVKALVLKSSLRARDRIKSEDLFKKLALDTSVAGEMRIDAIIQLCDLNLIELRITKDLDIINEIHPYIQELLSIAESQHSYLYLAETHLLQAKLSLLTLDIKGAKRFLTQAENIADSYGLKLLAMKISYEHDELLRQTKMWENLKISEVSLSERLELTGLNEQMDYMMNKRMIEVPELVDEDPILLLIISEGGVPLFTQYFIKDKIFKDHLLGGFFTAINSFVIEMFSDGLDRASFGDHTLLMKSIPPFLLCYVYKGQSYSAQKRIKSFIDEIKANKEVWDRFEKFYQVNRKIQLQDIPSLESLIENIFKQK